MRRANLEDAREKTRAAGARRRRAFTLIEVMIAVAIVGLLASIAGTNYFGFVNKARVARAIAELKGIATVIDATAADDEASYPNSLSDLDEVIPLDPWGNPYRYLRIDGGGGGFALAMQVRKDRFLVPLNTDFDLYSTGADGQTKPPLSAPDSADDVVRANNGGYFGLGEHY